MINKGGNNDLVLIFCTLMHTYIKYCEHYSKKNNRKFVAKHKIQKILILSNISHSNIVTFRKRQIRSGLFPVCRSS